MTKPAAVLLSAILLSLTGLNSAWSQMLLDDFDVAAGPLFSNGVADVTSSSVSVAGQTANREFAVVATAPDSNSVTSAISGGIFATLSGVGPELGSETLTTLRYTGISLNLTTTPVFSMTLDEITGNPSVSLRVNGAGPSALQSGFTLSPADSNSTVTLDLSKLGNYTPTSLTQVNFIELTIGSSTPTSSVTATSMRFAAVPEPGAFSLFTLGILLALTAWRARRSRAWD